MKMIMIPNHSMFTDAGNLAVDSIVELARKHQLSQPTVRAMLSALAQDERFEEATDTAVREAVFEVCFG